MSLDMSNITFDSKPASATVLAEAYDSSIIVNRWLGAWIDFVVLISFLLLPDYLLGNELYQKTLLVWLGLMASYFPVMETVFGKTVGKFITRTRVVSATGGRPSWLQSIVRTLFRLIEVNPLLFGGIPAGICVLVTARKQRLGDMAAGTYVLRDRDVAQLSRAAA